MCSRSTSTSRLFSFDQNMRILNTCNVYIFIYIYVCTHNIFMTWFTTWSGHFSEASLLLVIKILFLAWKEKNNWVFLYWKTIFNFAKEDLMWWFWRATSWVLTHSIQLSWSFRATGNVRDIKLTLKVSMIQIKLLWGSVPIWQIYW